MQNPEAHTLAKSTIFAVGRDPRRPLSTAVALAVRWAFGYMSPGVLTVFLASTPVVAAWAGILASACVTALGVMLSWLVGFSSCAGTVSPAEIVLYTLSATAVIWVA